MSTMYFLQEKESDPESAEAEDPTHLRIFTPLLRVDADDDGDETDARNILKYLAGEMKRER